MTGVTVEAVKRREITTGTKEWADRNVNCIKGCSNDCRYCYAKLIAKRFGRCTDETWKFMTIRDDIVGKRFGKYAGRVMFPSSHDITEAPGVKDACLTVIDGLLRAGNDLLVTTKPNLSITKDIITSFHSFRSQIQFRFTITSVDDRQLSFWEPAAPAFDERLGSLKHAYETGLRTSVSIEPFLDYDPRELVETVSPFVTESIWLGPMNYIPRNGIPTQHTRHYEEARMKYSFNRLVAIYDNLRDVPKLRFKDSMVNRLGLQAGCFGASMRQVASPDIDSTRTTSSDVVARERSTEPVSALCTK